MSAINPTRDMHKTNPAITGQNYMAQGNQKKPVCHLEQGISLRVDLETLSPHDNIATLLKMHDTQENSKMDYDEHDFQKKEIETKAKKS